MTFAGQDLGEVKLEELPHACATGVWVDAREPTPQEVAALRASLSLNEFALEDALERGHWSRYERYPEHEFVVLRTLAEPEDKDTRTERVSMFWTDHALLTVTNEEVTYLERVRGERRTGIGRPEDVVYELLDHASDTFFEYADTLREHTDDLEERLFTARGGQDFAREVFDLKHCASGARRLVNGARDVSVALSRGANTADAVRFRDVQSNLARVSDTLDSLREVLSSTLDVHLNVQNQRMNEIVKTLTTVSTLFLPLTFLAGVWGMNFRFMPELEWRYGYALAWGSMLLVALGLMAYFKRRGWW